MAEKDRKWELVQIKAFKAWVNGTLSKRGVDPIEDIAKDFQDGTKLLIFLEIVTNKRAPRYDKKPMQKIQKIQNLSIAINFIKSELHVNLETIGAEDLYDGNLKLILGMLWTLFRKLRIATIAEGDRSSEDGLLLWVKKMTADYPGVNINTFKDSFTDGLAFSALIHKFNKDLIDFDKARTGAPESNLENAFEIAEKNLGIPKLLEASDLLSGNPDERSVILYVSLYFHAFVSNEERKKIEASKNEITDKMTLLESRLTELESENEELFKTRDRLQAALDAKERERLEQERLLQEKDKALQEKDRALQNYAKQVLALMKELEDLKKKQIVQGKARGGLDILRINLEEHLEDMYRWRELHELVLEDDKRIFDLTQVLADIKDKTFDQQIQYLNEHLQAENKSLLRIIRLKDSKFKLKDIEAKSGWLSMKGRKDWKKRWFSLRGQSLYYYETEESERSEGFVDLTKGCEVVRQKAVKEDDSAKKQWPLKITVGERKLFVRAGSKKERHSWYLFLASKIAHINYLKGVEATGNRPDTRLISLFSSENVPNLFLDHLPINEEGAIALAKTLPAHDETETLSLANAGLTDASAKHLGEVLEKLNIKSLSFPHNKLTSEGCAALATGLAQNTSITEINLSDNQIQDAGVEALAAQIATKPTLTSINLSGNKITAAGLKPLVDAILAANLNLPELSLSRTGLDDKAIVEVARLLKSSSHITTVKLDGNRIGDAGAVTLADALLENHTVLTLDLSNNQIGTKGALAIEHLLKTNHGINRVNLSDNKSITGGPQLAPLLCEGFTFPQLSLDRLEQTAA